MPATVELSPLFDPTLDRVGFPLDHPYIERVYCSVLGPTSVLLLRRAGELFADHPRGVTVDMVEMSRSLGLGGRLDAEDLGKHSPLRRTMDRLARFKMARWTDQDRLGIHPKVPALATHQLARLTDPVRALHEDLVNDHVSTSVARAENRGLDVVTMGQASRPTVGAVPAASTAPPIAERLSAFGNPAHDPRTVAR